VDGTLPFVFPPAVHFSVYARQDVEHQARGRRISPSVLESRLMRYVRRHGLDIATANVVYGRWRTMVDGLDVLYDVGPGDTVMIVSVSLPRLSLEGLYEAPYGHGGRP